MNIKALITTLVLGSSTMASADSITYSGSVSVSLGAGTSLSHRHTPVVRDHRVIDSEPCAPATPVVVRPPAHPQPVWNAPYFEPKNTNVGETNSVYVGWMGKSALMLRPASWHGNAFAERRIVQNWFELTEPTRIDSGRLFFKVKDNGLYRAIKLQNLGNRGSDISDVGIEFKDSNGRMRTQSVRLHQRLDRNNPTITIDLDGDYRQINRIIVHGATDRGAAFQLLAM